MRFVLAVALLLAAWLATAQERAGQVDKPLAGASPGTVPLLRVSGLIGPGVADFIALGLKKGGP